MDISMSLDGFMTAAGRTPEEPMGPGGLRLMDWAFADAEGAKVLRDAVAGLGASIAGRETYETSLPWWGADGPSGDARRPLFVLTHEAPKSSPENGVYTFVTDGLGSALDQAVAAADGRDVCIMGGARTSQQYLAAGLVDELSIHLVPVLFHDGTRMFDHLGVDQTQLEVLGVISTPQATHLRYAVRK
ncbi:dihydrofolate reductase family protein [Actinoplanes sp. NPDC051513]|uniref:dihydrofolate reductase family protein n=1 Tax=Actinoplanes sp. NPDC051513 TaxID=3363908 RepID=UPI003796809B